MNQHYVPRVYLKNFASKIIQGKKKKKYFVDVFDRKENRFFESSIKDICCEVDLYTLEEGSKIASDLFGIEKMYSNGLEPLYEKAYNILTNHAILDITEMQRVEVLLGTLQMYPRNPQIMRKAMAFHLSEITSLYKNEKEKGKKGFTYLEEDYSFRDYTLEEVVHHFEKYITNDFKERHIAGLREIGDFHYNAILEVMIIHEGDDSEFMTSDNPLVLRDLLDEEDNYPLNRSKEFTIALNKKVALRLYHDNTKDKKTIYRSYTASGNVATFNKNIIDQSTRLVITNKNTLEKYDVIRNWFLENTSLEQMMNIIRQVLPMPSLSRYSEDMKKVIRYYLDKYDREGNLSENDQQVLMFNIRQISNAGITDRISIKNYR